MDNAEFFEALRLLQKEKGIEGDYLLEKIRAVLRRSGGGEEGSRLRYRDLWMDLDTREVVLNGRPIELTAREFELLHTLVSAPGRVFTRELLLSKLWGYDFYGDERVVDSHIKNLRHKLGRDYIETVRGGLPCCKGRSLRA